jgi:hypothetical protein
MNSVFEAVRGERVLGGFIVAAEAARTAQAASAIIHHAMHREDRKSEVEYELEVGVCYLPPNPAFAKNRIHSTTQLRFGRRRDLNPAAFPIIPLKRSAHRNGRRLRR